MKKIEYTKGSSEAVNRRTENTMVKRTYNDLQKHRKLKIKGQTGII
jgi:hypothetical protein